jgi:uncharacterized protein (DUF2141 family)
MSADLFVEVEGLRNDKGHVRAILVSDPKDFPRPRDPQSLPNAEATIASGHARIVFPNLPAGRWAALLMHDENDNHELDTNFLKIPKEGFAMTGKSGLRLPKFESSAFQHGAEPQTLSLRMTYLL